MYKYILLLSIVRWPTDLSIEHSFILTTLWSCFISIFFLLTSSFSFSKKWRLTKFQLYCFPNKLFCQFAIDFTDVNWPEVVFIISALNTSVSFGLICCLCTDIFIVLAKRIFILCTTFTYVWCNTFICVLFPKCLPFKTYKWYTHSVWFFTPRIVYSLKIWKHK